MKYGITIHGKETTIEIEKNSSSITITRDDEKKTFTFQKTSAGYLLEKDSKIFHTNVQKKENETVSVNVNEHTLKFNWKDPYAVQTNLDNGHGHGEIKAVMPGRVIKILVSKNQDVDVNQSLLVLEAMKMENEIKSPKAGKVSMIQVKEGDSVEFNTALMMIE